MSAQLRGVDPSQHPKYLTSGNLWMLYMACFGVEARVKGREDALLEEKAIAKKCRELMDMMIAEVPVAASGD